MSGDDLSRVRSEVNDHRLRINTIENLVKQLADNQKELSENIKELSTNLSKLEKKFTIFITALIVAVGFGDGITDAFIRLVL